MYGPGAQAYGIPAQNYLSGMKRAGRILLWSTIVVVIAIGCHIWYLTTLAAKETYPEDGWLQSAPEKTALVIVAHDDDMVGTSGTLTMLCGQGWKIREMCFYQQGGLYNEKDSLKNPVRKRSLQQAAEIQGLQGVDPVDLNFRKDMMTEKPYMPMPVAQFAENYDLDTLKGIIARYIATYRPSVIFTLDDSIGGYGHPDHVLISRLVVEHCRTHKADPDFPVRRVYQPVFAPSLAENILGGMEVYQEGKVTYGCNGMPLPNVQIDISRHAAEKKACMTAYTTEQNSLRKFWPWYNYYPAPLYFGIFDRDFFRVVDVKDL